MSEGSRHDFPTGKYDTHGGEYHDHVLVGTVDSFDVQDSEEYKKSVDNECSTEATFGEHVRDFVELGHFQQFSEFEGLGEMIQNFQNFK